jgi:hypothetical protein
MAYLLFDVFILIATCVARLFGFMVLFFLIIETAAYKIGNFGLLSHDFRKICIVQMCSFVLALMLRAFRCVGDIMGKDAYGTKLDERGIQLFFVSLEFFALLYTLILAAYMATTTVYYVLTVEALQRFARVEYNARPVA